MSEEHAAGTPAAEETIAAPAAPEPAAATPSETPSAAEPAAVAAPPDAAPSAEGVSEPAQPALKPHTDEPGLLQATPAEPVAEEKPAVDGEKPAESAALNAPTYEFIVPENFTVPPERLDELQTVMREANVPKEQAEKLWGMHTSAMEEFAAHSLQAQHDTWAAQRRTWRDQIASDPDLGGAGYQTNQAAANRMLDLFIPPEHREEMNQFLSTTGATDHPALFRFLLGVAKKFDEPQSGPAPNPRPTTPRDQQGRPPGGGARLGYTHSRGGPRS